jgi:hypothetical protein
MSGGAAEYDARRVLHRAVQRPIRGEAHELAFVDGRTPHEALGIDGRAIRQSTEIGSGVRGKDAAVSDVAVAVS